MSTNINSPGLFPERTFTRHRYSSRRKNTDTGQEFPFTKSYADDIVDATTISGIATPEGVSVSFEERTQALHQVAELYSRYCKRKPGTHYTQSEEREILQPLLKENELIHSGFDSYDIDAVAISAIISIRKSFGVSVAPEKRQRNLDQLQNHTR